jgi:dienelactone hydrolase
MTVKRWVTLAIALVGWLTANEGRTGTLVQFANVPEYATPTQLLGYLARPDGPGRFPAIVVLHGCMGISSHSVAIADRLKAQGYVALAIDSLGPRGLADQCGGFFIGQAMDAYAAHKFLSQLAFVDAKRIALLGQSMGGSSALIDVERGSIEKRYSEKFIAAIAYYPGCRGHTATLIAPTLILIGEEDEANSAQACREMAALPHGGGANLNLMVYPGVHHAFDVDWFQPGRRVNGRWFEYNEPAASDAWDRVRAFLSTHSGAAPVGKHDRN